MATRAVQAPNITSAAVYARISSDPNDTALGVARQLKDCLSLAEKKGWAVGEVFTDNDVTQAVCTPRGARPDDGLTAAREAERSTTGCEHHGPETLVSTASRESGAFAPSRAPKIRPRPSSACTWTAQPASSWATAAWVLSRRPPHHRNGTFRARTRAYSAAATPSRAPASGAALNRVRTHATGSGPSRTHAYCRYERSDPTSAPGRQTLADPAVGDGATERRQGIAMHAASARHAVGKESAVGLPPTAAASRYPLQHGIWSVRSDRDRTRPPAI